MQVDQDFILQFRNYLCELIKKERISQGHSGSKLAEVAGISQPHYWSFENKNGTMELKPLLAIISFLGLNTQIFSPIKSKALSVTENTIDPVSNEATMETVSQKLDVILALLLKQ